MTMIDINCWERGCACYDSRIADETVEVVLAKQGEPVAIIHRNEYNEYRLEPHDNFDIKSIPFNVDVPLYTTPQQRPWVGLTDDEIWEAYMESPVELNCRTDNLYTLSRTVEAKLREKNSL